MSDQRRLFLGAVFFLCLASTALAQAPAASTGTLKLVVPFAAGGGNDMVTRMLARKLTENTGQAVIVENKAGGNTLVATEAVIQSPPDGTTLIMQTNNLAVMPALYKKLSFDPLKDLVPVALVAGLAHVLVVHPSVAATSLAEFVALAKAQPGTINYASAGSGTVNHLAGELLKSMSGIDILHIPYKGGSAPMADLLSGRVQAMFAALPVVSQYIKDKRLRAVAVTTAQRISSLPEVRTIAESGYPGYQFSSWFGLLAPAGTPQATVDRLATDIVKAIRSADMQERLALFEVYGVGAQEFASFLRAEVEKSRNLIRLSGAAID